MTDEQIDALESPDTWTQVFDDAQIAALELANAMCADTTQVPDELLDELRFHYREPELAELLLVCGQANLNNRVGNVAKRLLGEQDSPA